jgi:CHASE3 domain sensor protein
MSQYLVRRANVLVLVVPLIFLGLIGALSWERLNASRDARKWSQHSYAVLGTMKDLAIALRDAERGQRGYVLTGKDEYLSPYREGRDRIALLQGELQKLTADNPTQQGRLRTLAPVVQHKLEELAQTVQARRDGGFETALRIVDTDEGRNHMREAEAVLAAMLADEQRLLDERVAENDARAAWVRWLVVAGSVLAVLTLLWPPEPGVVALLPDRGRAARPGAPPAHHPRQPEPGRRRLRSRPQSRELEPMLPGAARPAEGDASPEHDLRRPR